MSLFLFFNSFLIQSRRCHGGFQQTLFQIANGPFCCACRSHGPGHRLVPPPGATARSYNLMAGQHPLVKITLHPAGSDGLVHLASTLSGVLDFSQGAVGTGQQGPVCLQVT